MYISNIDKNIIKINKKGSANQRFAGLFFEKQKKVIYYV